MRSKLVLLGAVIAMLALTSCRVEFEGNLEIFEEIELVNTKGEAVRVEPGTYVVDVTAMRRPPRVRLEIYGLTTENIFDFQVEKFAGSKDSKAFVVPSEVNGQPFDIRYMTSTKSRRGALVKEYVRCSVSKEVCGWDDGEYRCIDGSLSGRRYVEYYPVYTDTIVDGEILESGGDVVLAEFHSSKESGSSSDYLVYEACIVTGR